MTLSRQRQVSLVILLLFTLLGIARHLSGGDDLSSSYFGCRVLAAGEPSHLYAHTMTPSTTVDDPVWHELARQENFLPPMGYVHPYIQTPLWAFSLQPLCTRVSFVTFNRIFIVFVMLSVTGTLLLVLHFWTPILFRPWIVAVICVCFYRAEPLRYLLALTQTQASIVFLTLLAVLLAKRKNPVAAGILLAIAASIKITPGFLVLYWLASRQFKAALTFTISFIAICAVTVFATGTNLSLAYLHELSEISNTLLISYNNQSLAATWMTPDFTKDELLAFHVFRLPMTVKATSLVLTIFASLAGGWMDWKASSRTLPPYGAIFAMVAATLCVPIAWTHYFILLIVPVLFLVAASVEDRRMSWAAVAVPIIAFNVYPLGTDIFKWTEASRFVIRPDFYTGLLSLVGLVWLALRRSSSSEKSLVAQ